MEAEKAIIPQRGDNRGHCSLAARPKNLKEKGGLGNETGSLRILGTIHVIVHHNSTIDYSGGRLSALYNL